MMNMILSVIVCFAMILGGTGSLPAVPETAATWTIRNITIDNGEQSITLAPEARITTAVGAEEATLHFEIGSGEQTLMPASGKISADGVQFELGGSGRSYSISEATLAEMAGMDEEDAQIFTVFADFFKNYGVVLGKSMSDPQFYAQFNEASMNALLATSGTSTETEVEIDGEIYPAQEYQFELTGTAMVQMMDQLLTCGVKEVEDMFASCLAMISISEGEEVSSFADMITGMEEDVSIPVNMVIAQQDGFAYEAVSMEVADAETGMTVNAVSEAVTLGEETEMTMTMAMGDDSNTAMFEIQGTLTGPVEAPTAVNMECAVYSGSEYSYAAETEGEEDYTSVSEVSMFVALAGETVNDLETMQFTAAMESYDESGFGDEIETSSQSFAIEASSSEALESDGSVTASWNITLAGENMNPVALSFDINRAEGAPVDYFAGATDVALTAEALNGNGEETSDEVTMLGMDAMGYVAGAYALTMDESVVEMMEMISSLSPVVETEDYVEEYEDYSEDYEDYEYSEATSVASFAEAAEIFEGNIPEFTAPEGYEIGEIYVDSFSVNASYVNGEKSFEYVIYDQYSYDGMSYAILQDGALAPLNGYVVELAEYDGLVDSATVYNLGNSMYFYFGGMEPAEAQAILAGLK